MFLFAIFAVVPEVKADTIIDSYSESKRDSSLSIQTSHLSTTSYDSAIGQTFKTPNNGVYYRLTSTVFYLIKTPSSFYDAKLISEIYNMTGNYGITGKPSGNALAFSDLVSVTGISSSIWQLVTFSFSGINQIILTPNTAYAILVRSASNGFTSSYYISVGIDAVGATHSGNLFHYNTLDWQTVSTYDTCFYVYGIVSPLFIFRTNLGGHIIFNGNQMLNNSNIAVYANRTYTISATPLNSSYRFLNFTYGANNSTFNPLNISINSNTTIIVYFEEQIQQNYNTTLIYCLIAVAVIVLCIIVAKIRL